MKKNKKKLIEEPIVNYHCSFKGICLPKSAGGSMGFGYLITQSGNDIIKFSSYNYLPKQSSEYIAEKTALMNLLNYFIDQNILKSFIYIKTDNPSVFSETKSITGHTIKKNDSELAVLLKQVRKNNKFVFFNIVDSVENQQSKELAQDGLNLGFEITN